MPRPRGKPPGLPKSGGRKQGVANVKTRQIADRAAQEGVTPLDYMLAVMRDEKQDLLVRLDAAKSAAPYIHSRLANVVMDTHTEVKVTVSRQELMERARREIAAAFGKIEPPTELLPPVLSVEQESAPSEPSVEIPPGPPREFAAPGAPETAPNVTRIAPNRHRPPPRNGSSWSN